MSIVGTTNKSSHDASLTYLSFGTFLEMGSRFSSSFNPSSIGGFRYILVTIYYCTKWVEAKVVRDNTAQSVARFLYENIITRFGYFVELFNDQGSHFINEVIQNLTSTHLIIHTKSTMYHPQANGLAEPTNKTLQRLLKKIVNKHRMDWHMCLQSWSPQITVPNGLMQKLYETTQLKV